MREAPLEGVSLRVCGLMHSLGSRKIIDSWMLQSRIQPKVWVLGLLK